MQLEPLHINDLFNIHHLQPEGWPDIIKDLEFYLRTTFCFPMKLEENQKIIGTGTVIIFENSAWLAHIIVDSRCRNHGYGSLIVDQLLNIMKNKNIANCSLVATELGRPVYEKFGFTRVEDYVFF